MENNTIQNYIIDSQLDLKKLVSDYNSYIYTIIQNITKNLLTNEDIEELISDVLFAIWKNREKINPALPLKPYIAGITKNIVKNKLRTITMVDGNLDDAENLANKISIDSIAENNEQLKIVKKELSKIGQVEYQIFIEFYCYGKRAKEIAQALNTTENNINTKLHRIKKKLKQSLKEGGFYYGK